MPPSTRTFNGTRMAQAMNNKPKTRSMMECWRHNKFAQYLAHKFATLEEDEASVAKIPFAWSLPAPSPLGTQRSAATSINGYNARLRIKEEMQHSPMNKPNSRRGIITLARFTRKLVAEQTHVVMQEHPPVLYRWDSRLSIRCPFVSSCRNLMAVRDANQLSVRTKMESDPMPTRTKTARQLTMLMLSKSDSLLKTTYPIGRASKMSSIPEAASKNEHVWMHITIKMIAIPPTAFSKSRHRV